jgi:hypothetical protein
MKPFPPLLLSILLPAVRAFLRVYRNRRPFRVGFAGHAAIGRERHPLDREPGDTEGRCAQQNNRDRFELLSHTKVENNRWHR